MRQIKFRGKGKESGKWLIGALVPNGKRPCIAPFGEGFHLEEVKPSTLGQFTGLTDSAGKEIYEGDIICTPLNNKVVVKYGYKEHIVRHNDLVDSFAAYGWIAKNIQNGITDFLDNDILQGEVIGNIHDNPSLIPNQPTAI